MAENAHMAGMFEHGRCVKMLQCLLLLLDKTLNDSLFERQ